MTYKPRVSDILLSEKIDAMGAVLVEGPKYCGKTTSCMQIANSAVFMSDPDTKSQNLALANTNVSRLLTGNTPRLIDEWQIAPQIWDAVRNEVDKRSADGQFILTGSAVPADMSQLLHSGTGRIGTLRMRTMSLWESQESTGEVSLENLFEGQRDVMGLSHTDLDQLAFYICRGGWPRSLDKKTDKAALLQAQEYYDAVIGIDISRVDGVKRDPEIAKRIMKSYARNQGAQIGVSTIMADIKANGYDTLSENTIYSYINALKKIFVIEDALAWNPNLRSKTAVRTADTRYFSDPSIAAAALGIGPNDLINDMETFGLIFESLAIRDLRIYAEAIGGNVYHYRDKNGLECDAVVHLRNGKYGLIEVKIGGDQGINAGAKSLVALASKIDTGRMRAPEFMMVLTGIGQHAYQREDGVLVVPIGCLKN